MGGRYFAPKFLFKTSVLNPLSAKYIKWSNTLKQFVGNLPTNCLSVFDHFVGLALKGLTHRMLPVPDFITFCLKSAELSLSNTLGLLLNVAKHTSFNILINYIHIKKRVAIPLI